MRKTNNKSFAGLSKIVAICACMLGAMLMLSGCGSQATTTGDKQTTSQNANSENTGETVNDENTDTTAAIDNETDVNVNNGANAADTVLDENLTYYANIDIKDYGTITVKLDQKSAPITVANFVSLAESGFYDGLTFHRIIAGFMMQGGDPEGNGTGGSDEKIVGEFADNGYDNSLSHTRGAISMARSSEYNSASSQFFIVHQDSTFLDGQYAVFGYVTEGLDVVDAVCEAAVPIDGNGTIIAEEQPVINSIKIVTE